MTKVHGLDFDIAATIHICTIFSPAPKHCMLSALATLIGTDSVKRFFYCRSFNGYVLLFNNYDLLCNTVTKMLLKI
jgi:hypothetical protein